MAEGPWKCPDIGSWPEPVCRLHVDAHVPAHVHARIHARVRGHSRHDDDDDGGDGDDGDGDPPLPLRDHPHIHVHGRVRNRIPLHDRNRPHDRAHIRNSRSILLPLMNSSSNHPSCRLNALKLGNGESGCQRGMYQYSCLSRRCANLVLYAESSLSLSRIDSSRVILIEFTDVAKQEILQGKS